MNRKWTYFVKTYLLSVLMLLCFDFSIAQYDNISFTNISSEDGLSQNSINKIFQDSSGFMWFATDDGLNKYDGYSFKLFDEDFDNKSNLITKELKFIDEDSKGNFWFGSRSGLNRFNKNTNEISTYWLNTKNNLLKGDYIETFFVDSKDRAWICTNLGLFFLGEDTFNVIEKGEENSLEIKQIFEDKDKVIWFVKDGGIFRFDEANKKIITVYKIKENIDFVADSIAEDDKGNLWLGSTSGVYIFNKNTRQFHKLKSQANDDIDAVGIKAISKSKNGDIWLGSIDQGLFKVKYDNSEKYLVKKYLKRSSLAPRLSSNHIRDIFFDDSNVLWVGTLLGGINKGNLEVNFFHFKTEYKNLSIVDPDPIFSLCEDSFDNLWIGTYGFGLYRFDKKTKKYSYYSGTKEDNSGLVGKQIYVITEDYNKNIWLCTGTGGLHKYNRQKDKFIQFKHPRIEEGDLVNSVIFKGTDPNLWIGTFKKGVYLYNPISNKLKHYKNTIAKNDEATTGWVNYIKEDVINNHLWVAFENGLNIIDLKTNRVYKLNNAAKAQNGLLSNYIYCIHQDSDEKFWLGTDGALTQILKYEFKEPGLLELKTKNFTKKEGLSNDVVYGILEDDFKNLWVSTNQGLSKFNRETKKVKNYFVSDGLQANEFNMGGFYKGNSGEFLFGGINGITAFFPKEIRENNYPPKMAITKFLLLNNEIKPEPNGIITKDINDEEELKIDFEDKVFSFEIAALEYSNSQKNQYAYMLEGFENDWNYIGRRRHITFTNLNPGKYTLKIKGTNNDGVWSQKVKSLKINIVPPFWRTIWFYIFCGLCFLGLGLIILKFRVNQVHLEAERKALYKKNEEKNAMLKEIHHRIKNNLQVVNSLLSLQSRQVDDKKVVGMFKDARKRVLSMAMLHEKIYGTDDLKHIDIQEHFKSLIEDLTKSYALDKKITLDITVKDVEMGISTLTPLGLMINEITTNSLKYAFKDRDEGKITVAIKQLTDKKYELIIGDDGIGLIENKITPGLGTKLIQIFTKQLKGTIERLDQPGTFYKVVFEKIV